MSEELAYQVALCRIPGVGAVTVRQLISYCGDAQQVFHQNFSQLKKIPGIGKQTARRIVESDPQSIAEVEIARARKLGIDMIFYTDKRYPTRLSLIPDAPLLLYTKGNLQLNPSRSLGIVGTRRISAYGINVAEQLFQNLAPLAPTVISGLAYGVDIKAHRLAVKYEIPTIGVLGHGLDLLYPEIHATVAKRMQVSGGLVTELPLGTKPDSFQFPKRNRIIAALSDALIVVEAGDGGGAQITAEIAGRYRRQVYAVPGSIHNPQSLGCHKLIKDHKAMIYTTWEEFTENMSWFYNQVDSIKSKDLHCSPQEQKIIDVLSSDPNGMHIDEISWKTQIPINRTGSLLLNLEFNGLVKCLPGKKFSLVIK